jgi:hypothetical protein
MVSDRVKDRNHEFSRLGWSARAGGTQEISRWCNHRISTPHHAQTAAAPWKGARRPRGVWRATPPGNIRTLLAPLPGRIPYRGIVG